MEVKAALRWLLALAVCLQRVEIGQKRPYQAFGRRSNWEQYMPNSLNPINAEDEKNDEGPTQQEWAQMRLATHADAEMVDSLILQSCTTRWRKVAMVVGIAMNAFDQKVPHLPMSYMSVRITEMERSGVLELAGDPMNIRFSEVRLAQPKAD